MLESGISFFDAFFFTSKPAMLCTVIKVLDYTWKLSLELLCIYILVCRLKRGRCEDGSEASYCLSSVKIQNYTQHNSCMLFVFSMLIYTVARRSFTTTTFRCDRVTRPQHKYLWPAVWTSVLETVTCECHCPRPCKCYSLPSQVGKPSRFFYCTLNLKQWWWWW